jgi:autotransporter-associated beta strand protein
MSSGKINRLPVLSAVSVVAAGLLAPLAARGQVLYCATATSTAPVAVAYQEGGVWYYAGAMGQNAVTTGVGPSLIPPGQTYGITSDGNQFYLTEQAASGTLAGRVLSMSLDGSSATVIAYGGQAASVGGTNVLKGSLQGVMIGPDNNLYFTTAFGGTGAAAGGPSGIWRVSKTGSGLQNVLAPNATNFPSDGNYTIRDITMGTTAADGSFTFYTGSRGGFGATGRPLYQFTVGATGTVALRQTLTTTASAPEAFYYDPTSNLLYTGRGGAGPEVATVKGAGTATQTPTTLISAANDVFDINRVSSTEILASGTAGQFYSVLASPGTQLFNLATISGISGLSADQFYAVQTNQFVTATYTGAGNGNLSSGANYLGGAAPAYGTNIYSPRLTFGAATNTAVTNDLTGAKIGNLSFSAGAPAFTITGNAFTLPIGGGIVNYSSNVQTISTGPITFGGGVVGAFGGDVVVNSNLAITSGGVLTLAGTGNITFGGVVSGAGTINKNNTGSFTFGNASNTFSGLFSLNSGALLVNSASAAAGLSSAPFTLAIGGGTNTATALLSNGVNLTKTLYLAGRTALSNGSYAQQVESVSGTNVLGSLAISGTSAVVQVDAGSLLNLGTIVNTNGTTGTAGVILQGAGTAVLTLPLGGGSSTGALTITNNLPGNLSVAAGFATAANVTLAGGATGGFVTSTPIAINSGVTVTSGAGTVTFSGVVSGGGTLNVNNSPAPFPLTNSGNTFSGNLNLNAQTLALTPANVGVVGTATITVGSGSSNLQLSGNLNLSNTVGLAGRSTSLPQVESISDSNALSNVSVNGSTGVIQTDAGSTLTVNGTVANNNGTTGAAGVQVQGAGTTTFNGAVGGGTSSGALTLIKAGTGNAYLNGGFASPSFTNVTVTGGTLYSTAALPSTLTAKTTLDIESGATFDATAAGGYNANIGNIVKGAGTLNAGNVQFYDDNAIMPGMTLNGSVVGTLTINGNTTFQSFGQATNVQQGLYFNVPSSPTGAGDLLRVVGSVSEVGSPYPVNITPIGGTFAAGTYPLINFTGGPVGGSWQVNLTGGASNYRQTFAIDATNANVVNLVVSGSAATLTWKGAAPAGSNSPTSSAFNVTSATSFLNAGVLDKFYLGDTVNFVDDPTASTTASLTGQISAGLIHFTASQNYLLQTPTNSATGIYGYTNVVKDGTGTVIFDGSNEIWGWTGALTINSGVLEIRGTNAGGNGDLPFGSGPLGFAATTLNGGTLRLNGAGGVTGRSFTMGPNGGTLDVEGTAAYVYGYNDTLPIQFSGSGGTSLTITGTSSYTFTFDTSLVDPTGGSLSIIKSGTNDSILAGPSSSYGGTLTVNSGRVQLAYPGDVPTGGVTVAANGAAYALFGTGTFTLSAPMSIAGIGAKLGTATVGDGLGALRVGNTNSTVVATGAVTLSAAANIGVDDVTDSLQLTGGIAGAGALNKVGAGNLILSGANTSTGNVTVSAGKLIVQSPLRPVVGGLTVAATGVTATFSVASPGVSPAVAGEFAGISVAAGGKVVVSAEARPTVGQQVLIASALSLATNASGAYTGTLDLADNDMIIRGGSESAIRALVSAWYSGGTYAGTTGLISSTAGTGVGPDSIATLAVITNSNGEGGTLHATFDGVAVASSDVLVKYTYLGDTNLDGVVDASDLANALAGLSGGLTGWVNGDFNYDGVVNGADLTLLLNSLTKQGASFGDSGGGSGAVPEPSLALALAAPCLLLGRRRRGNS